MARSQMTISSQPSPYATTPLDFASTLASLDNVNGMQFSSTGKEFLFIQNPTAGALTVTVHSAADPFSRTGDITAYSIAAGHFIFTQTFPVTGWASGGQVTVDASGAGLLYACVRQP